MKSRMENLKIRRAVLDDLPRIIEIYSMDWLRGSRENLAPDFFETYRKAFAVIDRDPNQRLLVAESEGKVIGTLQVTIVQHLLNKALKRAVVEAVFIDTEHQGKGIGTRLFEEATDWAREKGCKSVELTSNKKREDAHKFYKKLGFTASHEGFKKGITDPEK